MTKIINPCYNFSSLKILGQLLSFVYVCSISLFYEEYVAAFDTRVCLILRNVIQSSAACFNATVFLRLFHLAFCKANTKQAHGVKPANGHLRRVYRHSSPALCTRRHGPRYIYPVRPEAPFHLGNYGDAVIGSEG